MEGEEEEGEESRGSGGKLVAAVFFLATKLSRLNPEHRNGDVVTLAPKMQPLEQCQQLTFTECDRRNRSFPQELHCVELV